MYCPGFLLDIVVARVSLEFLHGDAPLESFAKKYSDGLSEKYSEVTLDSVLSPSNALLEFLSEVEAGEQAVDYLSNFTYFKLYFEKVALPRKHKPLFGTIFDGTKQETFSPDGVVKSFGAHVFGIRSGSGDTSVPVGWTLEGDPVMEPFKELVEKSVSLLDAL